MGSQPQPSADRDPDETIAADSAPERTRVLQTGTLLERRFLIGRLLGVGGMGEVYEAEDLSLKSARIALKTIRLDHVRDPSARTRFLDEVLLARSIAHPNVCPVYEMFSSRLPEGEIWFLTMKLLDGETLAACLDRGPMAMDEAVRLAHDIASGLDAIHAAGVVHRDLKPGNIFLAKTLSGKCAVLTDFGLARTSDREAALTVRGHAVGTPLYMAPEIRAGQPASSLSDIYSLGVVLHEMFTGGLPGSSSWSDSPSLLRIREAIAGCLVTEPEGRYATAAEAFTAVQAAIRKKPLLTRRRLMEATGAAALAATGIWLERGEIENWLHPLPRPRRVALLPAMDTALSAEDASLLNGLLESVGVQLERTQVAEGDLFIVPAREIQRQKAVEISQVLGLFGANLLLSASLQNLGSEVALGLQLTESATGKLVRKDKVSSPISLLYTLATRAANQAASLLDIRHIELLRKTASNETTNAEAYAAYQRGIALLRRYGLTNIDLAIAELQKAIGLDQKFAQAWAKLGNAYWSRYKVTKDLADLDIAERNIDKALALAPDLAAGYAGRAKVELSNGMHDAAIRDAQTATRLDPDNTEAQIALANTYVKAGKFDLAEQTFKRLASERPNDWLVLNDWGDFFMDQANYGRAEKLFREATILAPDAALPLQNLGAAYLSDYKMEEADRELNRAIQLLPSGESYSNLGTAQFWLGKYRKSADANLKAVQMTPGNPLIWRNLGDAYQMTGELDKARAAWSKAAGLAQDVLAVNPNDLGMLLNLAIYKGKLDQTGQTLALLARASKFPKPTVEQRFFECVAYELAGERDKALELLTECSKLGYSSADILHAPELVDLRKDARFVKLDVAMPSL